MYVYFVRNGTKWIEQIDKSRLSLVVEMRMQAKIHGELKFIRESEHKSLTHKIFSINNSSEA